MSRASLAEKLKSSSDSLGSRKIRSIVKETPGKNGETVRMGHRWRKKKGNTRTQREARRMFILQKFNDDFLFEFVHKFFSIPALAQLTTVLKHEYTSTTTKYTMMGRGNESDINNNLKSLKIKSGMYAGVHFNTFRTYVYKWFVL